MAIINNSCTEIGDIFLIVADIPLVGLTSINSYTDVLVGETANRYFIKEFKYSTDGLNYSDYIPLNNANLQAISVNPGDYFYIQYKYTRTGNDDTGVLEFTSISLNSTFQSINSNSAFNKSIFHQFINYPDLDVIAWCVNVLDKLYKNGIVPNYIIRRANQDSSEDRDYIDFFKSIAFFFATIIIYGRDLLEKIDSNAALLQDFLKERNLFVRDNQNIQDLLYLKWKYNDEIRQRGTIQITKENINTQENTTNIYSSKSNIDKQVDGELLRLISYNPGDEFIFNKVKREHCGWNVDNSSPLFKGLTIQNSINKAYEDSEQVFDLSLYPIYNRGHVSREKNNGEWVMEIVNVPVGEIAGIAPDLDSLIDTDFSKTIKVDSSLNYEISFWVKQPSFDDDISESISDSISDSCSNSWSLVDTPFTFGVYGFDISNNHKNLLSSVTSLTQNTFFSNVTLNKRDTWYFVRGIMYATTAPALSTTDALLNIGFGCNLKLASDISKIIPYIVIEGQPLNTNCLLIKDLKVKPLATPFETGFIQLSNFIEIWVKNNNKYDSLETIEDTLRRFLLPYNTIFKNIYI